MAIERLTDEQLAEGIELAACGDGGDCWVWWQEHSARALAELQALREQADDCRAQAVRLATPPPAP